MLSASTHPSNPMFRKSQSPRLNRHRSQQGYILLTLLLVVALLTIFAAAIVPSLTQQIKRDREEELIHRGVQYSRAVRAYYKKFNRYPTRIEDLESTNTIRFLRKRYKDPMNRDPKTGQERDFKLLHQGEVQMSFGAGLQGGSPALNALATSAGITPQNGQSIGAAVAAAAAAAQPGSSPAGQNAADADSADSDSGTNPAIPSAQSGASGNPIGQVFGGGPIVGVASASKAASIRSFNKKDHYNQWQFIYDPSTDRGGLLMTPNQPPLNVATQPGAGQPGTGQPGSGLNNGNGGLSNQPAPPAAPPAPTPPDSDNQ
ncbi:MAG: hypothetical protein WB421_08495 [Terriglobales bacterium]